MSRTKAYSRVLNPPDRQYQAAPPRLQPPLSLSQPPLPVAQSVLASASSSCSRELSFMAPLRSWWARLAAENSRSAPARIANACTQTGAGEYARQGWLHDDGQARQGAWNGRTRGWQQCRPALRQTRNAARLRSGLSEELACTAASRDYVVTRLTGEPRMLATGGATTCSLELIRAGRRTLWQAMAHLARR